MSVASVPSTRAVTERRRGPTPRQLWALLLSAGLGLGMSGCSDDHPDDVASFAGHTYLLSIAAGDWNSRLGSDVADSVPQFVLAVRKGPSHYQVTLATAWDGVQEPCNPTRTLAAAFSGYPSFQLGPEDFPLFVRHPVQPIGVLATARALSMTDILPTPGAPAENGTLRATMDAREIYPLFVAIAPEPTPDRLCALIEEQDAGACAACPHDGRAYCLELSASYLGAEERSDFEIEPIAAIDPACLEPGAE